MTMTKLRHLYLQNNELSGAIPAFPYTVSQLDLSDNHLSGMIPKSLGNLLELNYLNLGTSSILDRTPTVPSGSTSTLTRTVTTHTLVQSATIFHYLQRQSDPTTTPLLWRSTLSSSG